MILSAFYRENHYSPIMALRSSFGLLIQIPFFIAAYSYLSSLPELNGSGFLFINDMGKPDALIKLGNIRLNLLPILMTTINCISGTIYSKGHPLREKLQIYITAIVFLFLLYGSPSGLVLYWTMNNVLSAVKNIFYKMKHPLRVGHIIASLFFVATVFFFIKRRAKLYVVFFSAIAMVVIFLPLILKLLDKFIAFFFASLNAFPKKRCALFTLSAIVLALTAGLAVPAIIMDSSSSDYFYIDSYSTPFPFLLNSLSQATGLFIFWPSCIYVLMPTKVKNFLTFLWIFVALTGLANCFAFSGSYGLMNVDFSLMDEAQSFNLSPLLTILQILCTVSILALILIFLRKKSLVLQSALSIILISLAAISAWNIASINSNFRKAEPPAKITSLKKEFHLSKAGKNVILFMVDRFESAFMDEILNELPDLKSKFDGFTYYPNTVSMSYYTTLGAPGLFGGYDFTPWEINKRVSLTIREKHNQSLLVLPTLFTEEGFDVTVTNLPYENWNMQPVEQIYKNLPNLKRVKTQGNYSEYWYSQHKMKPKAQTSFLLKRNIIFFSLFKLAPPPLRVIIYGCGYRLLGNPYKDYAYLIDTYAPLDFLPELTEVDKNGDTFLIFDNELPHAPGLLQPPEYVPAENVINTGSGKFKGNSYYHVDCATLLRISEFFDWMKENGVYDNTRIVIVSDHGHSVDSGLFDNDTVQLPVRKESVQALLMVKDFSLHGQLTSDMSFMTNADVPSILLKDISENPLNPFTGNLLEVRNKEDYVKIATAPMQSLRTRDDKTYSVLDKDWITVRKNIFENKNWSFLDAASTRDAEEKFKKATVKVENQLQP